MIYDVQYDRLKNQQFYYYQNSRKANPARAPAVQVDISMSLSISSSSNSLQIANHLQYR